MKFTNRISVSLILSIKTWGNFFVDVINRANLTEGRQIGVTRAFHFLSSRIRLFSFSSENEINSVIFTWTTITSLHVIA